MSAAFLLIAIIGCILAIRAYANRPYIATSQLFVSVIPVAGASEGSVSSFEAESRQVAIDFSQVVEGRSLAAAVGRHLSGALMSPSTVQSDLSASANNRVVTITASTSSSANSMFLGRLADNQMLLNRSEYVGSFLASRTQVSVVGPPNVQRTSGHHILLMLLIRLIVGAVVAIASGLAWDYFGGAPRAAAQQPKNA